MTYKDNKEKLIMRIEKDVSNGLSVVDIAKKHKIPTSLAKLLIRKTKI